MSSIIINSFYRALTNIEENEGIKNLSVQQLTRLLVDILYPEDGVLVWENEDTLKIRRTPAVQAVTVPVEAPAVVQTEVKEVKVKEVKPKLTKEEKAAAKAAKDAAKAEKPAKAPKATKAKKAEPLVEAPVPEPVVEAPVPEPVVEAPVPEPVVEAPKAKETKTKAPKEPKAKFVGNLEKLNPTHDKLLKKTATESKVELAADAKVKFLTFVNAMDNKDFNAKKLEEHMKDFLSPKAPEEKDTECVEVDYKGKSYWVDPSNGDVYETEKQEDGSEIDKQVGRLGLAYFADMKMPVE